MSLFAEAALLQFVVSWARRFAATSSAAFADLEIDKDNFNDQLAKLLGKPYGVAAWVLSKKLTDSNGAHLLRSSGHVYSRYLDAMDEFDFRGTNALREAQVNLLCIQGSNREYIRPLYEGQNATPKLRQFGEIRVVVQDALAQLASHWTAKQLLEVSEPVTQLVRELVENSDWWARTDEKGNVYAKGVRAVMFRLLDIDDNDTQKFAGRNTHLQTYLMQSLTEGNARRPGLDSDRGNDLKVLSFAELSIVDSGPGLARRWLASGAAQRRAVESVTELSLEEEEAAVVACFMKWATSSGNANRGIGLFDVARLLRRKNGFLRLRTGRLAFLFGTRSAITDIADRLARENRDASAQYVHLRDGTHVFLEGGKMLFFLRPWSSDALGEVEGTSFSMLLPL